MKSRSKIVVGLSALVLIGGVVFAAKQASLAPADAKPAVLAVVNRQEITATDIEGLVASGMSKPVAIEAAVTRQLGAEAARSQWPRESDAVTQAVVREALANYYLRRRLGELKAAATDEDIKRYYDTNLKDEMYSGQALKYYLTQDAKDAGEMAEAVRKNQESLLGKFSWVNKESDHYILPLSVPYGLYQQVKALQPGQYAGPFNVRDGLLFLKLEDRKPGRRPELAAVRQDITTALAQQRLEEEVKELRAKASIQLK